MYQSLGEQRQRVAALQQAQASEADAQSADELARAPCLPYAPEVADAPCGDGEPDGGEHGGDGEGKPRRVEAVAWLTRAAA